MPLLPQQRREWAVRWGATTGGTCESTPPGSAASRCGGSGGGQQQQQRPLETLSPQQLREWAVRWGSPGGGGFRGTRTEGVEALGGVEATSRGACDSASAGAEPEEALHAFTLDSSASRYFFRDSTTVTPLPAPVPVTLADPSGGPVVAQGATILSSLPLLPRLLALLCLPCVEGKQRAAPHSSFPPTAAPLQTLHMDVWGPARWIRTVCRQLSAWFQQDLPVLRLHSDRGERRIGLVMETSPTLRWKSEVGDASLFRVWGALSLVRDPPSGKLSPRTLRCVFLGFPTDAPGSHFYHPGSRRILSSQDVTFDEYVCFYRLHLHRGSPVPLSPLALVSDPPPPIAPLPSKGPAPSGVSQFDPSPLVEPVEVSSDTSGLAEGGDPTPAATVTPCRSARLAVPPGFPPRPSSPLLQPVAVDSSAAEGGTTGGAYSGGAGSGGAECPMGTGGTGGAGAGGPAGGAGTDGDGGAGTAGAGGSATGGTGVASACGTGARRQETLSPKRLCEWAVQWGSPGGGASRARTTRAGGAGTPGAAGSTGGAAVVCAAVGSPGSCAGAAGSGGAGPGGASAGVLGVGRAVL
ncbi:unnamed protein product [Closterium sp. NIES-54]